MNPRTHLILDGLQDPLHARELSARWAAAGFDNAVDIAGQAGWIARASKAADSGGQIDEKDLVHITAIARAFGVEPRERVGSEFKPVNDLPALREQMTREYRARLAQSLVFGLPALAVHYLGPMLASGGGQSAGSMAFPWLLEMVLVGWALWVAGLPVLWQGAWSLMHLRPTADLLTTAIVMIAFIPSVVGLGSLLFIAEPWFGSPGAPHSATQSMPGPAFHIAILAIMIATCQRWLMHRQTEKLSGRGNRMLPHCGRLFAVWIMAMVVTMFLAGWQTGLAFGLLMPPLISSAGINHSTPGWSAALPVLAFAPFFLFAPQALPSAAPAQALRFEIAAGFAAMMILIMNAGWSAMQPLTANDHAPSRAPAPPT